jgi:hypothetical protein
MSIENNFPNLSAVTQGLNPALIQAIAMHIHLYSVEVQQEYAAYLEYQAEYEAWSDSIVEPNFLQDY